MSSKPIRLRSEAEAEIEQAFEYYFRENQHVAERFLDEIDASFRKIQRDPRLSRLYEKHPSPRGGFLPVLGGLSGEGRRDPGHRDCSREAP